MKRAVQKRTLETRAKLLTAASDLVAGGGYQSLRVEEVVLRAGVAKGTFFAHFNDKEALLEQLIAAEINAALDRLEVADKPTNVNDLIKLLDPVMQVMTSERYVFDLILRHSSATLLDKVGPIADTFGRFILLIAEWFKTGRWRPDLDPYLVAEGVQSFAINAMALNFCALHCGVPTEDRMTTYMRAWLEPGQ
ncbi:MAG: TetR/AcrR family transcriptional regulator [Pseudomonadota bacterium]